MKIRSFFWEKNSFVFDSIEKNWEKKSTQKFLASIMIITFLGSLLIIQFNRWGILHFGISKLFGTNHFFAIEIVFILLLIFEIISLVFSLSHSVAISMAKQLEIFSLILLRNAFKAIGHLPEPIIWEKIIHSFYYILSDVIAALIIFAGISLFKHISQHRPISENREELHRFNLSKKIVCNFLILLFIIIGIYDIANILLFDKIHAFFNDFYTILIFSDILIVIISIRYSFSYTVLFRNSAFAIATVLLRFALTAPDYFGPILGISATIIVVLISYIYNKFPVEDFIEKK